MTNQHGGDGKLIVCWNRNKGIRVELYAREGRETLARSQLGAGYMWSARPPSRGACSIINLTIISIYTDR